MTNFKTIISAAALSASIIAVNAGTPLAAEGSSAQSFKPLQGLSFSAGDRRGVGYFSTEAGGCHLVLTLAQWSNEDRPETFSADRHDVHIGGGQTSNFTSDGHTFEFGCSKRADAMTFKTLSTVASAKSE